MIRQEMSGNGIAKYSKWYRKVQQSIAKYSKVQQSQEMTGNDTSGNVRKL